ncbi:universal stress protein [Rhodobacteraceae bacterium 2376]|uniref:Universal stress protein n=1 Tax=Rhabdonatronobacter sediminivivens TaxID=2743469 RepID=A0A7Z0HYE2_9RHOB|nr:universal stress protein [Rhabdonatronobacter sediminivivens]NYS24555.1 universal stress protein [Rhabdonatronobacter sediminivivens]
MTNKIIALVDGSIYAQSVCDHAAWAAQQTGWAVELLHILGRRDGAGTADYSGSIALGARTALLEELAELDAQRARLVLHRGRAILEDARAILEQAGITEITTRLRHGDIVDTVAEQEAGAEMVLVGKRGEAADFARGHLGSNLERIVRASTKPVFVAARAFKPMKRVLIAYDGGASAMRAVDHVARTRLYRDLQVSVITVGNASDTARKGLADAKAMLAAAGIEAETGIVSGQPETALAKLVEQTPFDMLVMGAYGHSRIRSLIIGSTTTEMIRSCKVPIVLTR